VWTDKTNRIAALTKSDSSSITAFGEYSVIVQKLEKGTSTESDVADQVARTSWRRVAELVLEPEVCPRPWTDFNLGDTVGIDITANALSLSTSQRISQIAIELDDQLVEQTIAVSAEVK
jgi:hypothetical protein